jgi:hypothetical protein
MHRRRPIYCPVSVSDWRVWDSVLRHGPFTAGNFAQWTRSRGGAVTGLIDRLVGAGAVERVRNSQDRRKGVGKGGSATLGPAVRRFAVRPHSASSGQTISGLLRQSAPHRGGFHDAYVWADPRADRRVAAWTGDELPVSNIGNSIVTIDLSEISKALLPAGLTIQI